LTCLSRFKSSFNQFYIHEVNLAQALFGPFKRVAAFFPKSEKLVLDVESIADIMIYHEKNTISQIHLDYIQRPMSRSGTISFEQGVIRYDMMHPRVTVQSETEKRPQVLWEKNEYDYDLMYCDELRLCLQYIAEGRMRHEFDIGHAIEDIKLVEAAFESGKTGQIINVGDK